MLQQSCSFEHLPSAQKHTGSLSSIEATSDYFSFHRGNLHTLFAVEKNSCDCDLDCHSKHVRFNVFSFFNPVSASIFELGVVQWTQTPIIDISIN